MDKNSLFEEIVKVLVDLKLTNLSKSDLDNLNVSNSYNDDIIKVLQKLINGVENSQTDNIVYTQISNYFNKANI